MTRTSAEIVKKEKQNKFQHSKCDLNVLFWKEQLPWPYPDSFQLVWRAWTR